MIFGLVYAVGGTIDYTYFRFGVSALGKILYLGLQGCLVFGIFWTSRLSGEISLCVYPLAAATVALLQPVAAAIGVLVLYGMVLGVEGSLHGNGPLVRWAISTFPAFGFVVIFTRMAMKEKAARTRAESLATEIEKLAVIQERNRLAREIHDSVGHCLTTIHVQLEAAQTIHSRNPSQALEAVINAQGLVREALAEVRRSVGSLHEGRLPGPLTTRLRELVSATNGWGAAVFLEIAGEVRPLPPEVEHTLFRVAQEGLTNVRKHAQAQHAKVILDFRDRARVLVSVTDDGRGSAKGVDGQGLTGLRERAAVLGGSLKANAVHSGGFRVQAEIPA